MELEEVLEVFSGILQLINDNDRMVTAAGKDQRKEV